MNKRQMFPIAASLITIAGLVIRLVSLNQSLWLDEAISVNVTKHYSYLGIIRDFAKSDFHPPLFYEVLKFWTSVFGYSEISARSLSVLFGVATIPLIYLITKRFASWRAGLIAAVLFAVAPLHIYYSQEARMYAMETFLVAAGVYLFLRLIANVRLERPVMPGANRSAAEVSPEGAVQQSKTQGPKPSSWTFPRSILLSPESRRGMSGNVCTLVGFTIINIAIIYTDYLPAFIFVFYLVWIIVERKSIPRRVVIELVISFAITAIAFLPFLPIFLQQLTLGQASTQTGWSHVLGVISVKSLLLVIIKFLIGRISFHLKIVYAAYVALNVAAAGLAILISLIKNRRSWLAVGWLVIPLLLGVIFGLKLAIFDYFRFLFVLPAMYVLLAIGINQIASRNLRLGLLCATLMLELISSSMYLTQKQFQREDWRSAVQYMQSNSKPPAVTIFVNPAQADAYHYYASGVIPAGGPAVVSNKYQTIWLMRYVQDIFDPHDIVKNRIEALGYQNVSELNFNGVVVWEYVKP